MMSNVLPRFFRFRVYWWWLGVTISVVSRINEVNQLRAQLVLGWATVSGLANHLGV